jgi:spore coat protein U-like protein
MKLSSAFKSALPAAMVGALALCLAPTSASASTSVPTTFSVTATVQATCLISATTLAFGTYTGVVANNTSTVTVTCTNTTPYTLGLDAGTSTGATVTTRKMTGPSSALLSYSLFSDGSRTVNWGNTTGSWVSGTGNGAGQGITVYGQVGAGQYVTPGAYSDTITATVTY